MRPRGSADLIAYRRRRALALLDEGRALQEVARLIGCHASSVLRWRDARAAKGEDAFAVTFSPGRPPKLSASQKRRLGTVLLKGARAQGYRTELWTTRRIAQVVERTFGVSYHRGHVGRLMAGIGWSCQKPERRAAERDEPAIRRWRDEVFPEVKKTPSGWAPISFSPTRPGSN
jgi:transposase